MGWRPWLNKPMPDYVKREELVNCHKCECLIKKESAQVRKMNSWYSGNATTDIYFCRAHRVAWAKHIIDDSGPGLLIDRYFIDHVECDQDGKVLHKK